MSWEDILKTDTAEKKVLQMAKKVLRDLGLDEKFVDSKAIDLANSMDLFSHIPFRIGRTESEEEMYSQVTEKSLKDLIMANRGFYLPNLLNEDERFIQRKKEDWNEAGYQIVMELEYALDEGKSLPNWAVVENGKINEKATKEKYINEATRDFDDLSNSIYWEN
tara:strand:+ start:30 stop:521 length:492 start_codon:yes stop_codon:yes gene_type:complete